MTVWLSSWLQWPVADFYWPFTGLLIAGFTVVVLEEMEGPWSEKANNFWTMVFLLFAFYVVREHVERGYVLSAGRHWLIRDSAVIATVGGGCLVALWLGIVLGNIAVGIFRIFETIMIAIGGAIGFTARIVWKWALGPFTRLLAHILRPLASTSSVYAGEDAR
ncbi:MAG: hypothetical protein WA021_04530 [Minisyncoccia bacterium]